MASLAHFPSVGLLWIFHIAHGKVSRSVWSLSQNERSSRPAWKSTCWFGKMMVCFVFFFVLKSNQYVTHYHYGKWCWSKIPWKEMFLLKLLWTKISYSWIRTRAMEFLHDCCINGGLGSMTSLILMSFFFKWCLARDVSYFLENAFLFLRLKHLCLLRSVKLSDKISHIEVFLKPYSQTYSQLRTDKLPAWQRSAFWSIHGCSAQRNHRNHEFTSHALYMCLVIKHTWS